MAKDIWDTIKKGVADIGVPLLANAIVPGSGGFASSLVKKVLGVESGTEAEMIEAIANATPEQVIQLKELEIKHEERLIELSVETDKMYLKDVQNARNREIEIKKAGGSNWPMYTLGSLITIGFFALVGILLFKETAIPAGSREVAFMLFGTLSTGFGSVIAYFFGSSKGSSEKNKMLQDAASKK